VVSEIPDEQIKAMHLDPAHDAQEIVDRWVTENPRIQITVVDGANKVGLLDTGENR
jgi:hypothetical protein